MLYRRVPILILVLAVIGARAGAADWNQWRGPNRDGSIVGFQAPSKWPSQLKKGWSVAVGIGHASPLIVGESAFVFARDGEKEIVRRLALTTGKEEWRYSYAAPYEMDPAARGHGKGPKATPTYAEGRLFTFGISGILCCLDAKTGKLLWRKDFASQFEKTAPQFGTAASPLVVGERVIAHVGGKDKGALTAFEVKTGKVRWQWTGDGPSYASPILLTVGGVKQIVTQTQKMCIGIAPESGKLLWSLPFTTPYEQNSISPVAVGDVVVFGGVQQPTFACRIRKNGAGWEASKLWQTRDVTLYMSTPVAVGAKLYGMSERRSGQLFSLDAATGKTLWTNAGRVGDNAAVFAAGNAVLALTTGAELFVLQRSGDTLIEAVRYRVASSPTWASPAVEGKRILIKDETNLTLWEL